VSPEDILARHGSIDEGAWAPFAPLDDEGPPPPSGESPPIEAAPRFPLRRFSEVKASGVSEYLVKGIMPRRGLVVIWGPPKCGKSFWTFDLFMHVALDWGYRGHRVKGGPVVYCVLEGQAGFPSRLEAFRRAKMSRDADDGHDDPPFYLMESQLRLFSDREALIVEIRKQLGGEAPVAIVIDTLNRSIEGSENSDEDMGNYLKASKSLEDAFGCVVAVVHHCGWDQSRTRGHSSLLGGVDAQLSVKREKGSDFIDIEVEYAKDLAQGLKMTSLLKQADLGKDQDGDPITSLVVEPFDKPEGGDASPEPNSQTVDTDERLLLALAETPGATNGELGMKIGGLTKQAVAKRLKDLAARKLIEESGVRPGLYHFTKKGKVDLARLKRANEKDE
jgi:hypothetical protein